MSLFDFFGRDNRNPSTEKNRRISFDSFASGEKSEPKQNGPLTVFHPKSFKDVESIIETLRGGSQVIVYLNELSTNTGFRVLDMLSGAVFALDGGVYELENNVFIFTPSGIKVK